MREIKNTLPNIAPYLQVLEMTEAGVLLVNETGKVVVCNTYAAQQLGYTAEEADGLSIFTVNPHMNLLGWRQQWQQLGTGVLLQEETELMHSEGHLLPVELKIRLLKAGTQSLCCIVLANAPAATAAVQAPSLTTPQVDRQGSWELKVADAQVALSSESLEILGINRTSEVLSIKQFYRLFLQHFSRNELRELTSQVRLAILQHERFEQDLIERKQSANLRSRTLHITGQPQVAGAQVVRLYGVVQDISTISHRSEEMYMSKFTLDNAHEMIFWINEAAEIIYLNQSAKKQLGYTRAELKHRKVFDIDPNYTQEAWPAFWKRMQQNRFLEEESTHIGKSGVSYPIQLSVSMVKYRGEELLCAFVRSLENRKQRDRIIELTRYTLDRSQDIIFWIRENGQLIYCNQSGLAEFGLNDRTVTQTTIFDLNKSLDPPEFATIWQRLIEEGALEMEQIVKKPDGSSFWVEASLSHIIEEKQDLACIIWKNITLRKQQDAKLKKAIRKISEYKERLEEENAYLQEEISSKGFNFNNIISQSKKYRQVLRQVAQVADTDSTVLILGETGTGKELLASAIHNLSRREEKPMIKINCAVLPANLIESELFGHEKGAFTGAHQRKIGRFELANKGTIFLDEIGEMPIELQAKLLRVLQEGEFERLGGTETLSVDIRLIAATNRDLEKLIEEGKFREDLFYRLNVFPIINMPLRERREDIVPLIRHFMKKFADRAGKQISMIPQREVDRLMEYSFPGNIRELENLVERAVIFSDSDKLNLKSVVDGLRDRSRSTKKEFVSFEEMQRQYILEALHKTQWRVTGELGAARLLGLNGKTLASKMRKFDIKREDYVG